MADNYFNCSHIIYRNYEITYTVLLQRVLALYTLGHVQSSCLTTPSGYSCYGYWGWSLIWPANCKLWCLVHTKR